LPASTLAGCGHQALVPAKKPSASSESYGLDRSWPLQYLTWLRNIVLRFDSGCSLHYVVPVSKVIIDRMPLPFAIAFGSLLLTLAAGIPLGVYMAILVRAACRAGGYGTA